MLGFDTIKNMLNDWKRIFLIAKKPTGKEYWTMTKVIALGIVLIGIIAIVVELLMLFVF